MVVCVLAFCIDLLIGDPHTKWHPVALVGRLIGRLDRFLYEPKASAGIQGIFGILVVLLVLVIVTDILFLIDVGLFYINNTYIDYAVKGFLVSMTICPRSLAGAALEIKKYLIHGHIGAAREKVSWIVGRDTNKLDEPEIIRATVETVAENTIDGIIGPLFFYGLFGVYGAVLYRVINTMDSMLGYKNKRYFYYGRCAARLDDVCAYLPARITAVLLTVSACILRLDGVNSLKMIVRDARKHPSPNGGYAEAAVAGALHIRLGGYNSYFGKMTFRAYMGNPDTPLTAKMITKTVQLMYVTTLLGLVLVCVSR